jgi:hypothetical protein
MSFTKAREARIQAELYYSKMLAISQKSRFTAAAFVRHWMLLSAQRTGVTVMVAYNASLLNLKWQR